METATPPAPAAGQRRTWSRFEQILGGDDCARGEGLSARLPGEGRAEGEGGEKHE